MAHSSVSPSLAGDQPLVEAFVAGDELAFVALYNRYKAPVFAFCTRMLGDRAEGEDAMQEVFLRVYKRRLALDHTGAFKGWLFTIARNYCLNRLRKTGREERLPEHDPVPASGPTPFSALLKHERSRLVRDMLAELPPAYREVIVLREYQNLSYDEIARVTGATVSSVKSRLFKARRSLGEKLRPFIDEPQPSLHPS